MIDLDTRARSASDGLRRSVAAADLVLAEPPTVRRHVARNLTPAWAMSAGAVTALLLLFGVWALRPAIVADDLDATTTTAVVTATIPTTTTPVPPTTDATGAVPVAPVTTTASVDLTPPPISIASPFEGQVFEVTHVTFAGTTEPGARVFGGPYEATVEADGTWSIVLILSEGSNRATFTAVDTAGNEASASVTVVYSPPTKTTTTPKEPAKDPAPFVAHATSLESSASPPYGEYHGSGEPDSLVKVVAEWGSGETVVTPDGSWYLKVPFPKAPPGVLFEVKVKDQFGRYAYFTMTYTG
jgi:hypothetical protein